MAVDAEGNVIPDPEPPDIAQAQAFVDQRIQAALAAQVKPEPEVVTSEVDQNKQLQDLINPFIKPAIDRATFEARDAKDLATFYHKHPSAAGRSEAIEEAFIEQAKAGRATTRESLNTYLEGKEAQADPTAYAAKITERVKADQDRLSASTDIGSMAVAREQDASRLKAFENLSLEEMETALKGVTF